MKKKNSQPCGVVQTIAVSPPEKPKTKSNSKSNDNTKDTLLKVRKYNN